jgi:hypothetical protein
VGRILAAPEADQASLLARYHVEAAARYGEETARRMVAEMQNWIAARRRSGAG